MAVSCFGFSTEGVVGFVGMIKKPPVMPVLPLALTVVVLDAGNLPFSVWVAVMVSPGFNGRLVGTGTVQFPLGSTVVVPMTLPSLSVTTISAPGVPLPVMALSPSVG